jgi:16S rRNA (cytosine967-C5)-methyltransferase
MIYSTCSINRYENEETVARFIAENPGFSLVREQLSLPCGAEGEGFYTAEIKREKAL